MMSLYSLPTENASFSKHLIRVRQLPGTPISSCNEAVYENSIASNLLGSAPPSFPLTHTPLFAYAQLLAAIGRDKLIPQLAMFYPGENQEPRKGLALIYVGSSCIIMIGALNAVAPFITTWFLT